MEKVVAHLPRLKHHLDRDVDIAIVIINILDDNPAIRCTLLLAFLGGAKEIPFYTHRGQKLVNFRS